jgi:Rap1a immunity proteins
MKIWITLAAMLALPAPVAAQSTGYVSVNTLIFICSDPNPASKTSAFCHGYLSALVDALEYNRTQIHKGVPCIGTRPVTGQDLRNVVLPFLQSNVRENPLWGDEPAASLATIAVARMWCPEK